MTNEELVALIQAGERERIMELWAQVERLVMKDASRWNRALGGRNGANFEDYVQTGFLGFLYALEYYKPEHGTMFSTVLSMCIKTPFSDLAGVRTERQRREPLGNCISLDAPVSEEEDSATLGDFVEDTQSELAFLAVEDQQLRDAVESAVSSLAPDEQRVIRLIYWEKLTREQIAEKLGCSRVKVDSIHRKALGRLRHPCRSGTLRKFWEE